MILHDLIQQQLHQALLQAAAAGALGTLNEAPALSSIVVERPKNPDHGDYASPLAMSLSKLANLAPRIFAEVIAKYFNHPDLTLSIAGPGFINVRIGDSLLAEGLSEILERGTTYGQTVPVKSERILLEFVSANPTGQLHVGHGRWAALGSALANLLKFAGHHVDCEFYINDAGNQMDLLGESLRVRYLQALGSTDTAMPDKGYQGSFIVEQANQLVQEVGQAWLTESALTFREYAYQQILAQQQQILQNFRTEFDSWFSERTLHEGEDNSLIAQGIHTLSERGYFYKSTGKETVGTATFFRTTDFGDDQDRVVVRSDGRYTYMAADIAYHKNKLDRGYDRLINILGADHHGYVPRLQAIVQGFGYSADTLEVVIGQLVRLVRLNPETSKKEEVRMSKRTGAGVTIDDLLYGFEEGEQPIGADAARWYLLSQSADSQVTFDLDLAIQQSKDNLVYYAQYAHARTCSFERMALEKGAEPPETFEFLGEHGALLFVEPEERTLALTLLKAPEQFRLAAQERAPHKVVVYTSEVAHSFHRFYDVCRVIPLLTTDLALAQARWGLFRATRQVLANALGLLGIQAPTAM